MSVECLMSQGAAITWKHAGQGGTHAFSVAGLTNGSIRQGELHDLGTGPRPRRFAWRLWLSPASSASIDVALYLKTSDGSRPDLPGSDDAEVSSSYSSSLPKLIRLMNFNVSSHPVNSEAVYSGVIDIEHRYVAPVVKNHSGTFGSDESAHGFSLVPVPWEID
jgi:hypothetical protein